MKLSQTVALTNVFAIASSTSLASKALVMYPEVEGTIKKEEQFAVPPSTTVTTTDSLGSATTELLWYIPQVATPAIATIAAPSSTATSPETSTSDVTPIDSTQSVSLTTTTTAAQESDIESSESPIEEQSSDSDDLDIQETSSFDDVFYPMTSSNTTIASSTTLSSTRTQKSTTTRDWDKPLTIVSTTNSDGSMYNSTVWWEPETSTSSNFTLSRNSTSSSDLPWYGSSTTTTTSSENQSLTSSSCPLVTSTFTTHDKSGFHTIVTTFSSSAYNKDANNTYSIPKSTSNGVGKLNLNFASGAGLAAVVAMLL